MKTDDETSDGVKILAVLSDRIGYGTTSHHVYRMVHPDHPRHSIEQERVLRWATVAALKRLKREGLATVELDKPGAKWLRTPEGTKALWADARQKQIHLVRMMRGVRP